MARNIKVPIIPVAHDSLVGKVDFVKTVKEVTGKDINLEEASKTMQAVLGDFVEISTEAFNNLSDDEWSIVKRKVEVSLQKFALSLRTAMQLSLRGDDYPLKIINDAMRVVEEEVTFRALCELENSFKH